MGWQEGGEHRRGGGEGAPCPLWCSKSIERDKGKTGGERGGGKLALKDAHKGRKQGPRAGCL